MLKAVIAPIVGGIIGYITNDLAIRMLFRPRKSVYIGKLHIPFTPGLIPQQKGRIAASIGRVVSTQLLNEETLKQTILSEATVNGLKDRIRDWLHTSVAGEQRTIDDLLRQNSDGVQLDQGIQRVEEQAADFITQRIIQANAGDLIVDALMQHLKESTAVSRVALMLMDEGTQKNTRQKLAARANEMIGDKAPEIILRVLDKTRADYMNTKICDLYARYSKHEERIVEEIAKLYENILGDNLGRLLRAVNIEQIVVDKINSFDAAQLEEMIFGIMKRELRAIVYLGAALGFMMGFINLLF